MSDPRDLIGEWQAAMRSVLAAAASATGRSEVPRQLLGPLQRQVELVQEVLERERKLQRELLGRAFTPVDAIFDLLEQSGAALRKQAEALSDSARALEQAADLVRAQAELYERSIHTLRRPSELVKSAAGVEQRGRRPRGSR